MKSHIVSVFAAIAVASAPESFAQKPKAAPKAAPKPARAAAKLAPLPPLEDLKLETAGWNGTLQGANGDRLVVNATGAGCAVNLFFADGSKHAGCAIAAGPYCVVGHSVDGRARVALYDVQGGELSGFGAARTPDGAVNVFAEQLSGPDGLDGTYKITGGTNAGGKAYTGKVTIRRTGANSFALTSEVGGASMRGHGFEMAGRLWVAWTATKDPRLTVIERPLDGSPIQRHYMASSAEQPGPLGELVFKGGAGGAGGAGGPAVAGGGAAPAAGGGAPAAGGGKMDAFGNVIPDGPPPAGLEKPIDMPLDPPRKNAGGGGKGGGAPAPAAKPAAGGGGGGPAGIPAKGAEVDIATARKQLRDNLDQKIAEFMKLHNDARAEVGVAPLQWDPALATYAQEWADRIGASGNMEHRPNGKYGENLAGYLPQYGERPVHGAKLWYDEKKDYRGEKITTGMNTGHYTQMVWARSTHVGFGIAMTKSGMVMLCANYSPAGNMLGEHPYEGAGAMPAAANPAAGAPGAGRNKAAAPAGAPAPAAAVVGGIGLQMPKEWTTTKNGGTTTSVSPDGTARVILTTTTGKGPDGPWDDVQARMAAVLAPHLPGLSGLAEAKTEHDVFRDGVGLRVITYTGNFNGAPVNIVVDMAREDNVDGDRLVLIVRCSEQGATANETAARKAAESLRLRK